MIIIEVSVLNFALAMLLMGFLKFDNKSDWFRKLVMLIEGSDEKMKMSENKELRCSLFS